MFTFWLAVPEAPPLRVRCEPLSSQSLRVWWEPPPAPTRGGVLLGYEILYEVIVNMLHSMQHTTHTTHITLIQ